MFGLPFGVVGWFVINGLSFPAAELNEAMELGCAAVEPTAEPRP